MTHVLGMWLNLSSSEMFYGAEAHVSNQSNCYLDFEAENTYNELLMNDLCVKIINWIF